MDIKYLFSKDSYDMMVKTKPQGWYIVAVCDMNRRFIHWKHVSGDSIPTIPHTQYFHESNFNDYVRNGIY